MLKTNVNAKKINTQKLHKLKRTMVNKRTLKN